MVTAAGGADPLGRRVQIRGRRAGVSLHLPGGGAARALEGSRARAGALRRLRRLAGERAWVKVTLVRRTDLLAW